MASDSDESGVVTIGFAAAVGGLVAVVVDIFQKGDASAVFKLTGAFNRLAQEFYPAAWGSWPNIPVLIMGVLLVLVGIILAFWADARTRNAAFYSGASVISVLMTLVPYDTPLPPPSGTTVNKVTWQQSMNHVGAARILPASYTLDRPARLVLAAAGEQLPVTVVVHLPLRDGQDASAPARIDGRLYDTITGKQWQIGYADPNPTTHASSNEVSYRFDFVIETGAPRGNVVADLKLRVQAPGYQTATASQSVKTAGLPVTLDVTLAPSPVPKGFGGLGRILDRPSF